MITTSNYLTKSSSLDWSKLPDKFKKAHDDLIEPSLKMGFADQHPDTQRVIKKIIDALNAELASGQKTPAAPKAVTKPKAAKPAKAAKPHQKRKATKPTQAKKRPVKKPIAKTPVAKPAKSAKPVVIKKLSPELTEIRGFMSLDGKTAKVATLHKRYDKLVDGSKATYTTHKQLITDIKQRLYKAILAAKDAGADVIKIKIDPAFKAQLKKAIAGAKEKLQVSYLSGVKKPARQVKK